MKVDFYARISDQFWLSRLTGIDLPKVMERQSVHHFFHIDRSGSMYGTLGQVIEDLKKEVRNLQIGDAVTFGWFSSKRDFGFPIKAFRIVNESSFDELDRLFDRHKQALNLTCFSDSLNEIGNIVEETSFLGFRNCLTFFSDGWANDPGVDEEHQLCREILNDLKGKFDLVLTVAYSDYADRAFLAEMANIVGGECISAARLHQFREVLSRFVNRADFSKPKVKVELGDLVPVNVFTFDKNPLTGGINTFLPDETNSIYFSPSETCNLFVISKQKPAQGREVDLRVAPTAIVESEKKVLLTGAYAATAVLSGNNCQPEAIAVLGYLGDRYLVKTLGNSFSPTEKANAEELIRSAAMNRENRWKTGYQPDCAPKADAFCLLDWLDLVALDETALFYPRHPEFKYKRIGRKGLQREGYPGFEADENSHSRITDFVWHSELLNLSVRAKIKGTVKLPTEVRVDDNGKLSQTGTTVLLRPESLPNNYPTFQWRNYALIKDGFLNLQQLPFTCNSTVMDLINRKIPSALSFTENLGGNEIGLMDLSKMPVINRAIADTPVSANDLAHKVYQDEIYTAELKTLNFLRKELDPKGEIVSRTDLKPEEERFLSALGFSKDGSYSPPTEAAEATDFYSAKQFVFKIKGFSSLPKIDEVRERIKLGKTLNKPAQIIAATLKKFADATVFSSLEEKLVNLDTMIGFIKQQQAENRRFISKTKFALVLGHRWFTDCPFTDQPFNVELDDDTTAVIQIKEQKVWI